MKTFLFVIIFVIYFLPQQLINEKIILISALLICWTFFVAVFIIRSESKRIKKGKRKKRLYIKEIPNRRSVIELGYLMNGKVTSSLLGIVLMELVRKGALILKYNPKRRDYIFVYNKNTTEDITDAEQYMLEWFLRKIGDGESFSLSLVRRDAYTNSAYFLSCYDNWHAVASFEGVRSNLLEPKKDIMEHAVGFVVLSIILAFIGIILGVPVYLNFISLISTFLLLVYVNMFYLRTEEGILEYSKWISFGHSIQRGDACNEVSDPSVLRRAILYAKLLNQRTNKMTSNIIEKKQDTFENDWFILYDRSGIINEICKKVNKFVPMALAISFIFYKNKGSNAVLKYRKDKENEV